MAKKWCILLLLFGYCNAAQQYPPHYNGKIMLQLTVDFQTGPIYLNKPLWVTVTLKNIGQVPVLINKRLEMGYRKSISRELYAEMENMGTPKKPAYSPAKINRDDPAAEDYSSLQAGESITKKIDFFQYYHAKKPGKHKVQFFYQGNEARKNRPVDVYKPIIASEIVFIDVLPGKMPTAT
jgi:hypothetical protein